LAKKRILILAANPKNVSRFRLDEEVREIENGLTRAQRRDEFELKAQWATRPQDIRRAMLDFKPNIVHFCGHGEGEDGLAFEDNAGQAKLVPTEALAGLFELFTDSVECVVLNACYSAVQAEAIVQHIVCVVWMKQNIGDASAREFAMAFYDALGAGKAIEFAFKLGCNAIHIAGIPEHLTPVLLTKSGIENIEILHDNPSPKIVTAFFSYNPEDQQFVEQVANALCQRGIQTWLDADDIESLKQVVNTRMGFVGFLSKSDLATGQLQDQLQNALHVDQLDIAELPLESSAEQDADKISRELYRELNFENVDDVNIVIDQRGHGSEPYQFSRNVEKLAERLEKIAGYPTLVFRPNIKERAERATLVGKEWETFRQNINNTLETLKLLKTVRKIHILGDGQLGLTFFLGQYFNRTNTIPLECYKIRHKTVFTNKKQEWYCPPPGGDPHCETVAPEQGLNEGKQYRLSQQLIEEKGKWELISKKLSRLERQDILETDTSVKFKLEQEITEIRIKREQLEQEIDELEAQLPQKSTDANDTDDQNFLPRKIKRGEKHRILALYVGTRNRRYLKELNNDLNKERPPLHLVFVETGRFNEPDDALPLIRDLVALLQRLSDENETQKIRFYTSLPFNVVPLISANLTEHIIKRVDFMERDFGGVNRAPGEPYLCLLMENNDKDFS